MTRIAGRKKYDSFALPNARGLAEYSLELLIVGAVYFALAKAGALLVATQAPISPIWPASGWALAAVLLRGLRVWRLVACRTHASAASSAKERPFP